MMYPNDASSIIYYREQDNSPGEQYSNQYNCGGEADYPSQEEGECFGLGCNTPESTESAKIEGEATAKFWECMDAGGTEEACPQ